MAKQPKTFFGLLLKNAWNSIRGFFKRLFEDADHNLLEFAISLTTIAKNALQSKALDLLTGLTSTKVDDAILKLAREKVLLLLAAELIVHGLDAASTKEDVEAVATKITDVFEGLSDKDKGKLYTSLAAELYILFMDVKNGKTVTFGSAAALVEAAYKIF